MARIRKTHKLEGFSGRVGKHLKLQDKADGRKQIEHHPAPGPHTEDQWEVFKEAVAYARQAQNLPEYQHEAEVRHTSAFKVATADFLHCPEIVRVDLENYHGHMGDPIDIEAHADVAVTGVGLLLLDEENHLLEMGMAQKHGDVWRYLATHEARSHHHIRVIVDAADLPGHLTESRIEVDV
ncbi:MAG TPA: hypothetical protein VGO93_29770 [Candidatus Xenobia bacterium]